MRVATPGTRFVDPLGVSVQGGGGGRPGVIVERCRNDDPASWTRGPRYNVQMYDDGQLLRAVPLLVGGGGPAFDVADLPIGSSVIVDYLHGDIPVIRQGSALVSADVAPEKMPQGGTSAGGEDDLDIMRRRTAGTSATAEVPASLAAPTAPPPTEAVTDEERDEWGDYWRQGYEQGAFNGYVAVGYIGQSGDVPVYVNENAPELSPYPAEIDDPSAASTPEESRWVRLMRDAFWRGFKAGTDAGIEERNRNAPPTLEEATESTDSASTDPADEDDGDAAGVQGKDAVRYIEFAGMRLGLMVNGDIVLDTRGSGGAVRLQPGQKGNYLAANTRVAGYTDSENGFKTAGDAGQSSTLTISVAQPGPPPSTVTLLSATFRGGILTVKSGGAWTVAVGDIVTAAWSG